MSQQVSLNGYTPTSVAAIVTMCVVLVGSMWQFNLSNAWTTELRAVERDTASAIRELQCSMLQDQLRQIELQEALDGLSERQQAWYRSQLREWQVHCAPSEARSREDRS